jgi:hypothetical protein
MFARVLFYELLVVQLSPCVLVIMPSFVLLAYSSKQSILVLGI